MARHLVPASPLEASLSEGPQNVIRRGAIYQAVREPVCEKGGTHWALAPHPFRRPLHPDHKPRAIGQSNLTALPARLRGWLDSLGDQGDEAIVALLKDGGTQWESILGRLGAYRAFLERCGYDHLLADPERLVFTCIREIAGVKLGIAGFNTAWSCCRSPERGKLWWGGRWQVKVLDRQLADCDLRFALTHHPGGWFTEAEDPAVDNMLKRRFDLQLHGHEHRGWIELVNQGAVEHDHLRISAGACYAANEKEKGYNFGRLDLAAGTVAVFLRRYDETGEGWVALELAHKTKSDGRWQSEPLRQLVRKATRNIDAENIEFYPRSDPPRIFISYSHIDEEWKERLAQHLTVVRDRLDVWDDRRIQAGDDWRWEIEEALAAAEIVVLLISKNFLASRFVLDQEIPTILARRGAGLRVLPVIVQPCAWDRVPWLASIQVRPRDGKALSLMKKVDAEAALTELVREIVDPLDPEKVPDKPRVSISRLPVTGENFVGREAELSRLDVAWNDPTTNVISFVAFGGVGKSTLLNRWLDGLAANNWRGAERVLGWSFYSQGTDWTAASGDAFVEYALEWFGYQGKVITSPWEKGAALGACCRYEIPDFGNRRGG